MTVSLRDVAPNFTAQTTEGLINFYEWAGLSNWIIIWADISLSELSFLNQMITEQKLSNVKFLGLLQSHEWEEELSTIQFPLILDKNSRIHKLYGMREKSVMFIAPDKKIMCLMHYPSNINREFVGVRAVLEQVEG